jgi:transposase
MNFFVGLDVSKEKFDACGIGEDGKKVFTPTCSMDREGFEQLIGYLPKDKTSFLLGMESTASYHIALFTYLTARDYSVVVINPLLINNFSKRSLRKTKTDKKDALTIAQFLLQEKETLSVKTPDYGTERHGKEKRKACRSHDLSERQHEEDSLRHIPGA